jgi:PncC family amidohydrolase
VINIKDVLNLLKENKKTISTMESCTGGFIASSITDMEGSSEVFKFAAVTYSNEFKIKMGVDKNKIEKYTVYSMEVADEMSKNIADFAGSNYGIGITGQINRIDPNNITGEDNKIYISIYDKYNAKYYNEVVEAINDTRKNNKEMILQKIIEMLKNIIK